MQWVQSHWELLVGIQQALFSLLALICELLGKTAASKWFGTYTTLDAGRLARNGKAKSTVVNGSIFVGLFVLTACAGSLGAARQQGIEARRQQLAKPGAYSATTPAECQSIDDIQKYVGYSAYITGSGAVVATGVAAVPGMNGTARDAALLTGGILSAVTVGELAVKQDFTNDYEKNCQLQPEPAAK